MKKDEAEEVVTLIGEAEKHGCSKEVIKTLDYGRKALHEALGLLVNGTAEEANSLDLPALEGRGRLMIDLIRVYRRMGSPCEPT
jgi:hypothetical protein